MGPHLSETELASWPLDGDAGARGSEHLEACADCRARLHELRRDDALFRELSEAVQRGEPELTALLTRDAIPGYELLGEISTGGQGAVYLARQLATGRQVALKVLSHGTEARPRDRLRFEREVSLACRLNHPNVVRVYESGETAGRLWYAMELAEGRRLDEVLEHADLDREARLVLFERIAGAVAYAHACGVMHRDLKPANILVDARGEPHVVDFGLALALASDSSPRLTATGEFLGTLDYGSPEQVSGGPVDTRTDVHALGLLLYEMLTGRLPWKTSGSVGEVLERIAHDEPADPCTLSEEVDGELRAVLLTALAKDPDRRYPTADALLRDVRRYRAREPLEARPHTALYVLRLALVRHRVGVATAAVLVALVVGSVFAVLREQWRTETQRREAALTRSLMRDLVGAGEPMNDGQGRLAVLEDSIGRLEDELNDAPDVQAVLLLALGESHAARLQHAEAEQNLRRAIERFREAGDEAGAVRGLEALAAVLAQRGDSEAVTAAEQALAHHRERHGDGSPQVAMAQRLLARTLIARLPERDDDSERAQVLLDEALASLLGRFGPDHPEPAATQVLRARLAGSDAAALELYAQALEVLERRPGEARRTLECLDGYAGLLASLERFEEADQLLQRSAQLTRQVYGERHTVDHLRGRSRIEFTRGNLAASERLARAALATEIDGWSERRPGDPRISGSLAARLRSDEPAPYVEAFQTLRELRGNGDFALSSWMNGLSLLLNGLGRHDQAEALLRESLEIYCRVYGTDCPNRQSTLCLLAERLSARGRHDQARACLDEVLEISRRTEDLAIEERARELLSKLAPAPQTPTPLR